MRTFKKAALFILANLLVIGILTAGLAQPSALKILIRQAKDPAFETMIIGQSHGQTSIDPFLLSEQTGQETMNLSTRSIPVIDLYYIMAEADSGEHYKTVIYDLDPSYWCDAPFGDPGTDSNLFSRMTGTRKLDYFYNVLCRENYNLVLSDYKFSPRGIFRIPQTIRFKLSPEYLAGEESALLKIYDMIGLSQYYRYEGRGWQYGLLDKGEDYDSFQFKPEKIPQEVSQTFDRLVTYCRQRGIQLICMQSALPYGRLLTENMDEVHDYFSDLCSEKGVPFYDMNYLKPEYLPRTRGDYLDEDGHMTGPLAQRHTAVLAQILNSNAPESFFVDTYEQVLSGIAPSDS